MLEIKYDPQISTDELANRFSSSGFILDRSYKPVLMSGNGDGASSMVLYGTISNQSVAAELEALEDVIKVWSDAPVAPYAGRHDSTIP